MNRLPDLTAMPVSSTVDSADAAATLGEKLRAFDATTRNRGAQYYRAGRVVQVKREADHTVRGRVSGGALYDVALRREGAAWSGRCTCPMGTDCKHVYAVALAWLGKIPPRPGGSILSPSAAPRPAEPVKLTFRQEWEPQLAEKIGRPLTAEEGAFLGKLSQIFHNFRQSGRVLSSDLARLGFATVEASRGYHPPAFEGWWTSPPGDPMELWQYIAHDIESSGFTVPEFLRPVTDTVPLRARLQDRIRREVVARWTQRFSRLVAESGSTASGPEPEVPSELLELRLCIGESAWVLETRSRPDAPWKSPPRAFLDRFARDTSTSLTDVAASPAVHAFLAICQDHYRRHYVISLNPKDPSARGLLRRLLTHRLARTLVVTPAGEPLAFSPVPLVWRLTPARDNARDYELALHLPEGLPLPPAAMHFPGKPDYYLHERTVYRGPPALDGSSATSAIVPAEVVEQPEVLQMLRQFGTHLPAEIEQRFVNVVLRTRIECGLEVNFSGHEILVLKLIALSDQPPIAREWSAGGWVAPRGAPQDHKPDAAGKIHSFDYTEPQRAATHLAAFRLSYDEYQHRWTRRVMRTFAEDFTGWRASLPPEIEVLATGELASLLGAPVRARVDFELIETTVHRDWFDLALALKPEDSSLTPEEIALLLKARGKLVRLPGKGWRRLTIELEGESIGALEAAGFDADSIAEAALAGERHRFHALQLSQTALADLLPERQAAALQSRARAIALPPPPEVPAGLRATLRPYQREGFHFLAFLSANQLGGVLADDMGLGKTVQTLAWLLWLAKRQAATEPLRVLVVCPKSVVGNWEAETARFAPALKTLRFSPKMAAVPPARKHPQVVLANYTQLRLGADYFSRQQWHAVILDEGQFIKTPTSKVAQIARNLPGEQRLILTGTPIENRLLDLWSLFAFAMPGLLGTQAAFKRHYSQENPLALTRLRARVRHFLLRRTKAQVATDLPARTEEDVGIDLEGEQAKLYQAELKRARAQLLKVETKGQLDKARFNILASLLRLRQICCHPALIDSAHRDMPSAKLEELLERLEELRDEGNQVLVFSQFVEMLELIREKLTTAGIGHLMLTGQTENRDELVQQFQTDRKNTVFLLSLKAAAFGLNLTAASYVILYDPWWNPAVEAQAIDRTHRIGQREAVNAYRFIARGTVEEKIRALQKEKSALAGAIVQEESLAKVLDLDSLRHILS